MDLLERQDFLDVIAGLAESAANGRSGIVLVAGEAGVGKTSLVDAFVASTEARRLAGSCDGSFTPRALGPLLDIAEQAGGALAEACREGAGRADLFALTRAELVGAELTVVTIEDVHWADEATLDLVRYLSRRLDGTRTLVVLTYRDDGLPRDHPLRVVLGELASNAAATRLQLAPLSEHAVASLCTGRGAVASEVYRLSGGNPFFVRELLDSDRESVPQTAADVVLARLAPLSSSARAVVDAASVVGTRVGLDVLRRIVDTPLDAVDECLTSGMLLSEPAGFRFRHEIARAAVEDALAAHRRQHLHALVLETLRSDGCEDVARLTHHAEGALDVDAVLEFAEQAATQAAALGAHREAAAQYGLAVRFADDVKPRERAALLDHYAVESSLIDRWEDTASVREEALRLWREVDDPLRVGDEYRLLSTAYWRLCRGDDAETAQRQAVAVLEEHPRSRELGWAYAAQAGRFMTHGDLEGVEWARKAQTLGKDLGDDVLIADAMHIEGCILANDRGSDRDFGVELMRRSLDLAIEAGADAQAGRAYTNLHAQFACAHEFEVATALYVEGLAFCVERDLGTYAACMNGEHAHVLVRLGRWDEAEAFCAGLLDEAPSPVNRLNPLLAVAAVRLRRGSADAAALVSEAVDVSDSLGEAQWRICARLKDIELAWSEGRLADAAAAARAAVDDARADDAWSQGALAAWLRRLDEEPAQLPWIAEPYALELAGRWGEAAEVWRRLGCPYDRALALLDSGEESMLREAHRILDELGALPAAAKAQRALRALGATAVPRGRRAATRTDPHGLTPREREVLAELVAGATNAEIAERLVISEKTAGHHVSAILSKLGVDSRRDAARVAAAVT